MAKQNHIYMSEIRAKTIEPIIGKEWMFPKMISDG
jgi:hypothetical protein